MSTNTGWVSVISHEGGHQPHESVQVLRAWVHIKMGGMYSNHMSCHHQRVWVLQKQICVTEHQPWRMKLCRVVKLASARLDTNREILLTYCCISVTSWRITILLWNEGFSLNAGLLIVMDCLQIVEDANFFSFFWRTSWRRLVWYSAAVCETPYYSHLCDTPERCSLITRPCRRWGSLSRIAPFLSCGLQPLPCVLREIEWRWLRSSWAVCVRDAVTRLCYEPLVELWNRSSRGEAIDLSVYARGTYSGLNFCRCQVICL